MTAFPPIVFVHGNGDSAALWHTTLWRFESNGWPADRLHAFDLPYPLAREDDGVPEAGRSSSTDFRLALADEVTRVLRITGAAQVVLVASSRGGYAVRSFIAHGGAAQVSHAVLAGTPNHGVWVNPGLRPGSEFNGAGPVLSALNTPDPLTGHEVTPGVLWLTLRSDHNDKYAQADATWMGLPGVPTQVDADGPALRGALNVVLPGADHREVAFSAPAFERIYQFITGQPPAVLTITPQQAVTLDGKVFGMGLDNRHGSFPNNLPLAGATVEVYATDADTGERHGDVLHRQTIGADGRWGPLSTDNRTTLEFVLHAEGYAITHIYRSRFARSSNLVHLRADRLAETDRHAAAIVTLTRPRGYFGLPRDHVSLDGHHPPPCIPAGVAGVSIARVKKAGGAGHAVVGEFNAERIVGRAWPVAGNHLVWLELHH